MEILSNTILSIPIRDIQVSCSPYNFSLRLKEAGIWQTDNLFESLDSSGVISPVVVVPGAGGPVSHEDGEKGAGASYGGENTGKEAGQFQLVDGFKRLTWATQRGLSCISAVLLDKEELKQDRLFFFLLTHHEQVVNTPALKAMFLAFCVDAGACRDFIIDKIQPALGLGPRREILGKYIKISRLPLELLRYCHEKSFSMKRCLNLTFHDPALLARIFALRDSIKLSASLFLELLDNITDILRRDEMDVDEFFMRHDVQEVLNADMDISRRTMRFRGLVRQLRFPSLTRIEREMEGIKRAFFKDVSFELDWDKTLENRRIEIRSTLTDMKDLSLLREDINNTMVDQGIRRLLAYL